MKAFLYIAEDKLGEFDFSVIDESMGVFAGCLVASQSYEKYRPMIHQQCAHKGISNIHDFDYRVILEDGSVIHPEGGIGVTDIPEFDEIYVEVAGVDLSAF